MILEYPKITSIRKSDVILKRTSFIVTIVCMICRNIKSNNQFITYQALGKMFCQWCPRQPMMSDQKNSLIAQLSDNIRSIGLYVYNISQYHNISPNI